MIDADDLPDGWVMTIVGDLAVKIQYGYTASAVTDTTGYRFLRITDIQNGSVEWATVPTCEITQSDADKYLLQKDDILFARTGATTGKSFLIEECPPSVFASYLIRLRLKPFVESKFMSYYFNTPEYWAYIFENVSGIAQPSCNAAKLANIPIPLPPLAEQRRIVARIEALQARSRKAREALAALPPLLEQYRQALLAAAFRGDLTADWRERHPDTEPASALLERIRQERRRQWEAKNPRKTYVEPEPVDDGDLPELPEGWCWATLGLIATVERGRFLIRPRNDPKYFDGSYPFVQIGDLPREGGNIDSYSQTLNDKGLEVSRIFPAGTALIAIVGATIGNSGILAFDACCPDSLIGVQGLVEVQTKYIEQYFRFRKLEIRQSSYASGGQPNINLQTLLPYPIPLPSENEAVEIGSRLDKAIGVVNDLIKQVSSVAELLNFFDQSILAKAFRGELVEQDPADEPAATLLERIRAEREASGTPAKKAKRKRT